MFLLPIALAGSVALAIVYFENCSNRFRVRVVLEVSIQGTAVQPTESDDVAVDLQAKGTEAHKVYKSFQDGHFLDLRCAGHTKLAFPMTVDFCGVGYWIEKVTEALDENLRAQVVEELRENQTAGECGLYL